MTFRALTDVKRNLIAAALAVAVGLAACSTRLPLTLSAATPSTAPLPTTSGLAHFTAPGIAFDYPSAWVDETATVRAGGPVLTEADLPAVRGHRFIVELVQPGPNGPDTSGSMFVSEYLHPLPTDNLVPVRDTKVGGLWARLAAAYDGDGASRNLRREEWYVAAPDGGFYMIMFLFPTADLAAWRPRVDAVMASVALSEWTLTPAPAINGRVHYDDGYLAFDYPLGWSIYYPVPAPTSAGEMVLAVSSTPLGTCTDGLRCAVAPRTTGAMAIRFESTTAMWRPDWSLVNDRIGGSQAIREDGTEPAGEWHSWTLRNGTGPSAAMSIQASLAAPDLPPLRQALAELMATMRITPVVTPSPEGSP
jgi:hypothetical protein